MLCAPTNWLRHSKTVASNRSFSPSTPTYQLRAERHLAEQAGRDPNTISITAFAAPPDRKVLHQQEAAGAERAVFFLPAAGADKVLPLLDEYAKLI